MQTIENIVNCHIAVRERAQAGLPAWERKIKIKDLLEADIDSNEHVASVAKLLSERLKNALPDDMFDFRCDQFDPEIEEIIAYFSEMRVGDCPEGQLVEYFDDWLTQLYDWADAKRVWFQ